MAALRNAPNRSGNGRKGRSRFYNKLRTGKLRNPYFGDSSCAGA